MLRAADLLRFCRYSPRVSLTLVLESSRVNATKRVDFSQIRTFAHVSPLRDAATILPKSPRRGRPPKVPKAEEATSEKAPKKKRGQKSALENAEDPFSEEAAGAKRHTPLSLYTDAPLHSYSPPIDLVDDPYCYGHLPHPSRWRSMFAFSKEQRARHRYFVSNKDKVAEIVRAMGLNEGERQGIKSTIIEAYPGPGTFTRAFMEHPAVEKVISMENVSMFLTCLEQLRDDPSMSAHADKLRIIPDSGYSWDTYETLVKDGHLSHLEGRVAKLGAYPPPMDWDGTLFPLTSAPSPIVFFAQLPNTVHGEQLFAQLVNAISSRLWLFQFGRVKMVFVCGETVALRSMASPQDPRTRAKLGATVQCLSTPKQLLTGDEMEPYAENMYPPTPTIGPRVPVTSIFIPNSNISTGLQKRKLTALEIDPLRSPLIDARDMDSFEFLTRNMFVLKSKTVVEGLKHTAPGANNILRLVAPEHPSMKDRPEDVVLPDTPIVELTNRQWASLASAFERWPFRPDTHVDEGRVRRGLSEFLF